MSKADTEKQDIFVNPFNYETHSSQGLEDTPAQQFPEYRILQPQSPEIMDSTDVFYGSDPGLIYNRTSKEVMSDFRFVPCYIRQMYSIFRGNKTGKREFLFSSFVRPSGYKYDEVKGMIDSLGHSFDNFIVFMGLHGKDDNIITPLYMKFGGTNYKPGMAWIATMNTVLKDANGQPLYIPPAYSRIYHISSKHQKKDAVQWYTWEIDHSGTWLNPQSKLFLDAVVVVSHLKRYFHQNIITEDIPSDKPPIHTEIPF